MSELRLDVRLRGVDPEVREALFDEISALIRTAAQGKVTRELSISEKVSASRPQREAANDLYYDEGDRQVNIDDDALLSDCEDGCYWVSAWVLVRPLDDDHPYPVTVERLMLLAGSDEAMGPDEEVELTEAQAETMLEALRIELETPPGELPRLSNSDVVDFIGACLAEE